MGQLVKRGGPSMYRGVEELSGQGEVSSSLIRGGDRPSRGSKRKSSAEAPTKASAKQSNIASAETSNTTRAASAGSKAVGVGNIAAVPEVAEGDISKYLIAKLAERDMNAGAATGHVAPFTDTVGITTRAESQIAFIEREVKKIESKIKLVEEEVHKVVATIKDLENQLGKEMDEAKKKALNENILDLREEEEYLRKEEEQLREEKLIRLRQMPVVSAGFSGLTAAAAVAPDPSRWTTSQRLDHVIETLRAKSLIGPNDTWPVPDIKKARKILALDILPPLCGRRKELNHLVKLAYSGLRSGLRDSSKDLDFVSGLPGTGKTRLLFETGSAFSKTGDVGVIACTFKGDYDDNDANAREIELIKMGPAVPVVARLMHSYMCGRSIVWGQFLTEFLEAMQDDVIAYCLRQLNIGVVIDLILTQHKLASGLLLLDDTLRLLRINHTHLISTKELTWKIHIMVTSASNACYEKHRAFIFSAFSIAIFDRPISYNGHNIKPVHLSQLPIEGSDELTRKILKDQLRTLAESSDLTEAEVVDLVRSEAVGGFPLAADMLVRALDGRKTRSFITVAMVIEEVQNRLAAEYFIPWDFVVLVVSGVKSWPHDAKVPGYNITGEEAVNKGYLSLYDEKANYPSFGHKPPSPVKIYLPPVLLQSALLHRKCIPNKTIYDATRYLSTIALRSPRSSWLEIVFRVMILRSHLASRADLLASTASNETTAADAVEIETGAAPRTVSICDMFGVDRGGLIHCAEEGNDLLTTPMEFKYFLSSKIVKYLWKRPPSPHLLTEAPELMSRLFTSESDREPGIDGLFFVRESSGARRLVAVGIQCEWLDPEANTMLNKAVVEKALNKFRNTMVERGWSIHQLVFVALAHRDAAGDAMESAYGNNAIVLKRGDVEEWLGPSLNEMACNLNAYKISSDRSISMLDVIPDDLHELC